MIEATGAQQLAGFFVVLDFSSGLIAQSPSISE
jgi:hypothetical protein